MTSYYLYTGGYTIEATVYPKIQSSMENLPPEYLHEPQMALAGGFDGMDIVRRIVRTAGERLTDDGLLIVEIGTEAEHALAARNRGERRGVLPDGLAGGGVHGAVRKMQGGPLPAVGQRGRVGRQLQRRHGGVTLPDGGHQSQPGLVVFVAAPRQAALCLGEFNAGGRGQS